MNGQHEQVQGYTGIKDSVGKWSNLIWQPCCGSCAAVMYERRAQTIDGKTAYYASGSLVNPTARRLVTWFPVTDLHRNSRNRTEYIRLQSRQLNGFPFIAGRERGAGWRKIVAQGVL